ncbi:hypothetical protein E2C01_076762 [Portunus trituberculatus]|uniref:Uncharacterized protein n=1 Tax=Portunus trituberculatus TaxID=210409 RepID=A0A5B7IKI3_PORTR|nr:hypothetical protein [Portunus trituberculatus]
MPRPGGVWLVAHSHVTASVVTMLREISRAHFRWACWREYGAGGEQPLLKKEENEDKECGGISGGAGSGGHGRPPPLVQYSTTQGCRQPALSVVTRRPPLRPPDVRAASAPASASPPVASVAGCPRAAQQPAQQEERVSARRSEATTRPVLWRGVMSVATLAVVCLTGAGTLPRSVLLALHHFTPQAGTA